MAGRFGLHTVPRTVMTAVVLAVVITAVAALATVPAHAIALPGTTAYYSDATYTTIVGADTWGCCGQHSSWGTTSKYKKFYRLYCLDVICPF